MKINKFIVGLGLSVALLFPACDNVLDVEPEFQRGGNFTSLADYEFSLTGTYARFRQVGYYGNGGQTTGTWSVLPDLMGEDLVQTAEDLANWQNQINFEYATDDADIATAWLAAYSVITQANITLRGIDAFASGDQAGVNRIKGQALAIRAMVHFDLLRYWGENFDRNSTGLGVPYMTEVNAESLPKRLTVKETYDNIFRDMMEAETLLNGITINDATRSRIDQLAVRALLARINLYAKDYVAAENYATLVISQRPLASRTNFADIWKDASTSEVIWSVTFSAGEGTPSGSLYNGPGNRNRAKPSETLIRTYDQMNDVRFTSYFASRALGTANRRILSKFLSRGTTEDNLVNWKVLRTGEMYLIRAEARAMQGGAKAALALADLNALRNARINNYVPVVLTGQALLDAIALERRKELIGEGHRFFDLKRTTRNLVRTDVELASTNRTVVPSDREWVWPIPQGEIDANINIRGQQSPGY
ncbi:RagB/SusD family nutrient uptake outer membrane protein [Rufibacter tibetensis]|uniref:Glycan metabolism protein n=1 Tax=Rufibacter tibetensis TaxID=512763 RepID=A0A0N7HW14_9BACT|nr:RagB/SusD family nutrient uptake outer membrane protein [Rufibacter tibetensis]ALI97976.1 glycan metabolism protein [Rufibacter tibetensis]